MAQQETASELPPHVLIFPVPLQGHINSMLKLAELLSLSDLHVTLLLSHYTHGRLRRLSTIESLAARYPGFRVASISDGLPDDHPRFGDRAIEVPMSLFKVGESEFRKLMETTDALSEGGTRRRVTCLVLDGTLSFAAPLAQEMGIPFLHCWTAGSYVVWANFCFNDIIETGEIPLKGKDEDKYEYWKRPELDLLVTSVPGMEGYLRLRDLPAYYRVDDINDPTFRTLMRQFRQSALSDGLIFNSFEDLEGPILDQIRKLVPNVFSIGPLHTHLKARLESENHDSAIASGSMYEEDRSSITWLDSQPPKSVLYVSFGSVTTLTRNELLEFWYGLVNSGHKFLWVMRPDSIIGDNKESAIPAELEEGTKERGYIAEWVPQNEVLGHPSVAAFFTHSGWNSTMEAVAAGLPMICWPYFADQMINSRIVSEVWKVGLDMKDTCDRGIVQKMVGEIMEERRDEFSERARNLAESAKKAIGEGGTSHTNLKRLIQFFKSSI